MANEEKDEITINWDWLKFKKKHNEPKEETKSESPEEDISLEGLSDVYNKHKSLINNLLVYGLLALIIIFAFNSRIQNIPHLEGKYLISPDDPYIFYRYANYIATNGHMMENDTMRYYPQGFDTKTENLFVAYVAGYALNFGKSVDPSLTMFDIGAWFAPVLLVIALAAFFFLSKEVFDDNKIALMAVGILAFSQAILFRTAGGFLEKEPLFLPLMFFSMLFFIKAYKKNGTKSYIYGALAGIFTGLSAYASGLFFFMQLFILGFFAVEAMLEKLNKNKFLVYTIWFIASSVSIMVLTIKYGRLDFYKSLQFQLPAISLVLGAVSVFLKKPAKLKILPKGIFDLLVAVTILLVAGIALFGPAEVLNKINYFADKVQNPLGTDRFVLSVSEAQPPVFYSASGSSDWWHTFGLFFRNPFNGESMGIGVIFLLFFFGSILLFYKNFKNVKFAKYITVIFFIFMCALVFEHFSSSYGASWVNTIFSIQFVYIGLFIASMVLLLVLREKFEDLNSIHLFLLVCFIISVLGANGAVRLFFILIIPSAILAAYFLKESAEFLKRYNEILVYLPYLLAALIIIASGVAVTSANASSYPGLADWYTAMDWVKANTSETAVFTHWWDYGYLVQAIGERTTVVDPGNFNVTRNYFVGGKLFNAFNNSEVLSYLDEYHPNYWLINSEDVLKFYQIARLGSLYPGAEGRESYFSIYSAAKLDYTAQTVNANMVPNNINKIPNYTHLLVYESLSGQSQVLENFRIGNKLYEGDKTYIIRFIRPITNTTAGPVYAQIFDSTTQSQDILLVKCMCLEKLGCFDVIENDSIPTCIMFTKYYIDDIGIINIPYKSKDVLFTQLYLLDKNITGFNKVYDNGIPLNINSIRNERTQIRIYEFDYNAIKANVSSTGWQN